MRAKMERDAVRQLVASGTFVGRTSKEHGHAMTTQQAAESGQLLAIPFDTTQITSPGNYSQPRPGDECHPLSATAHAPAIAYSIHEKAAGERLNGEGIQPDVSFTLESRHHSHTVAYRTSGNCGVTEQGDKTAALNCATCPTQNIVAFQTRIARNGRGKPKEVCDALTSSEGGTHSDSKPHVAGLFGVRRLTPLECERLMGFPDNWTTGHSDSARYRMLGNAVVPRIVSNGSVAAS